MSAEHERPGDGLVYMYRPSLLGAPWEFRLDSDGIAWSAGRRSGSIPYAKVRRVRMSFRPANMQSQRFMTEIWADEAPKLKITSTSWKSMLEQERLDGAYVAFVTELHRRLAASGAVFEQGSHRLIYWPGVTVFAGLTLALLFLVLRALQTGAFGGAALVGLFALFFFWQGGNYFRRNRPGVYSPDAPPELLLPKA